MTIPFTAFVAQAARWMVCLSLSVLMVLSLNQALAQGKFIDVTSKVHQKILYGYRDNIGILDNSTAAWADYDNDGRQDFFIIGKESTYRLYAQLYHNTGNGWEDVTEKMIPGLKDITDTDHWAIDYNKGGLALGSVTWVDYNNDKRMDLFLSGNYGFTRSLRYSALFHNTGNGFEDVTKKVFPNDLAQLDHSSVVWGDIDGDGWKDLLMTGSEGIGPSGGLDWLSPAFYCYLNKGGTSFEDAWNENNKRPLNYNWPTRTVGDGSTGVLTLANYTNDSRVGLATNNNGIKTDPDQTTSFYTYDASLIQFIRVQDSDIFLQPNNVPQGGSIAWADYDGDNRIDMFITGFYQGNDPDPGFPYVSKLYRNTGQGYEDVTYLLPSLPGLGYSGKVWFDFNKDGRQDLFVSGESNSGTGITKLYMNTISGFTDVTNQLIPDLRDIAFKSVDTADYDKDGWTDLLLTGSGTTRILHNEVAKPQLGSTEQALQLIAPLYNCQTGAFIFQTQGGKGSGSPDALIEFMAAGITGWTTNPHQFVDYELRQAADAQPITLWARQNGQMVRYVWNIRAICPVDAPDRLHLLAPLYDCQSGAFTFRTQGGDGSGSPAAPIEFMAAGITGWTTNPHQFVDYELRQAADAHPITLMARQLASNGAYIHDRYVWDLRAVCPVSSASARLGAVEPGLGLQVNICPTPVDEEFMVRIEGAQQQSTRLLVTDLLGRSLVNKPLLIEQPTHFERVNLSGTGLGVYLLRVSSGQHSRTIKVIKQR